ncbi:VCBS repeat-containing protein, partial [candidate division WOR-3 bacterium]|nr:VCBS repeat-containing protein [candidate division WOR-3 bacterium]
MRLFAVVAILLPVAGQADVLVARTTDAANGGVVVTEQWSGTAPAPARDVTLIPMPNWPKQVGVGSMYRPSGVTLADINGDDTLEVIVGSTDNTVHVWDYHGNSMPGWPKTIPGAVQSKVAVGDLYGDGRAVLFVMSRNGSCYAFKADGGAVPGWPQSAGGSGGFVSPTLSDLDGNDTLEVIGVQYPPGTVYVWKADGTVYPGWPKSLDYLAVATASVGDVDADGTMEICVPSYRSLYLWDKDGNIEPG